MRYISLTYNIPFMRTLLCIIMTKPQEHFLWYQCIRICSYQGYKEITMVGFDALDPQLNNEGNVYEGTGLLNYHDKYTKESPVFAIQKISVRILT